MKLSRAMQIVVLCIAVAGCARDADSPRPPREYTRDRIDRLMNARADILGEAALKQQGGPSYEYFRDLMPPLRYVDANFRHYPITLSAPGQTTKVRLVSNGSAINALQRSFMWRGETGRPVTFMVGDKREVFGLDPARLDGPRFAEGYLPIVQLKYTAEGATYAMEVFASTEKKWAEHGLVLVKLTLLRGSGRSYKVPPAEDKDPASTMPVAGVEAAENYAVATKDFDEKIEALIEGPDLLDIKENRVVTPEGKVWATMHPRWTMNPNRGAMIMPLKAGESAYLAIC